MARTLDRIFPMLSRNAMVSRRIENAHGLMLSMSAATAMSGSSHFPPSLKFHSAVVPMFSALKNQTSANSTRQNAIRIESFLLIWLWGDNRGKSEFQRPLGAVFH